VMATDSDGTGGTGTGAQMDALNSTGEDERGEGGGRVEWPRILSHRSPRWSRSLLLPPDIHTAATNSTASTALPSSPASLSTKRTITT